MSDLTVAVLAVALGGFIKGVSGMGFPLIAIPLIAVGVGVPEAVVLTTIPTLTINALMIRHTRADAEPSSAVTTMIVTGVVGTVIGTFLLTSLPAATLSVTVAIVVAGYLTLRVAAPSFQTGERASRFASPPVGLIAGVMQGATGVSGPLVAAYVHSLRLTRSGYLGGMSRVFQAYGVVQLIALVALGEMTADTAWQSVLLCVPGAVAVAGGMAVSRKLPTRVFEALTLLVITASAAKLVLDTAL